MSMWIFTRRKPLLSRPRPDLLVRLLIQGLAHGADQRAQRERLLEEAGARRKIPGTHGVVVCESRNVDDLQAAHCFVELFSDLSPAAVRRAVARIHAALPGVPIEAAGSMTLESVRDYAEAGVDYVTVGALTHSVSAADLSLRVIPEAAA